MKEKYYLGIDQGTTGTTSILFDEKFRMASLGYEPIQLQYPQSGWVEHNPEDVWNSVFRSIAQALNHVSASGEQIVSVGLNHEGETIVVWDKITGKQLYNSIVWQDRRTVRVADMISDADNNIIYEKTGLRADAYFSATKIKWVLENVEGAKEKQKQGSLMVGTIDSWLIWRMTNGCLHITDASTASRTMLYNVNNGDWDDDLLDLFEIQKEILPEIRNSSELYGYTDPHVFFGVRIPISGILVDQQAAMLGQACVELGQVKTTYGTGCFMLMNTGEKMTRSTYGLLPTVGWQLDGKRTYALDGGVYTTGGTVKWMQENLGLIEYPAQSEIMAMNVSSNGGTYFVPAFVGLAAPHWDSYATGTIIGITGSTTKEHIVRAGLESTAYQVRDVMDVMKREVDTNILAMRCNGRATKNRFLMQFQADLLGIPLDIPKISATTAFGAAFMGALGIGVFDSVNQVSEIWGVGQTYEPKMSVDERESLMYNWHRAVKRAKHWNES